MFNVNQVYNQKVMFYITKDFHNLKKQNMVCALFINITIIRSNQKLEVPLLKFINSAKFTGSFRSMQFGFKGSQYVTSIY